jgi:quercetin dioxygenase-like cupin family protein
MGSTGGEGAPSLASMNSQDAVSRPVALARSPQQADRHPVGGGEVAILLRGEDTSDLCAVVENTIPAGYAGPPLHYHERTDELVYLVAGELTFRLDDEVFVAGPGAVVHLPRGCVHSFANLSERPATMVNFCTAGAERFFDDLALALREGDGTIAPAAYGRIAATHDTHPVHVDAGSRS